MADSDYLQINELNPHPHPSKWKIQCVFLFSRGYFSRRVLFDVIRSSERINQFCIEISVTKRRATGSLQSCQSADWQLTHARNSYSLRVRTIQSLYLHFDGYNF